MGTIQDRWASSQASAIYAGVVLLATRVLPFSGPVPVPVPVAVAVATLAAAALSSPLRRRVQKMVDRQFNRARRRFRHSGLAVRPPVSLPRLQLMFRLGFSCE